ncbi:hypothetical protein DN062_04255 [Nitrincola tibetensis]|uniref:DUF2306 domain-containing protein n=1 Tax=Nitrincola tibetensis TaxID=2219697 RepID=A0A364NQW6_9GAMM|nr:DUF2306 domain-containing protein [Nitrincola tibetensis]RAU19471.1 hypothetical protein DN062_04255 [Nitrincola tibetensis]
MSYVFLAYMHLVTVVPAFLIGTFLLLNRKGTLKHRALGKVYMLLMLSTALITLFMTAQVGPTLLNHFGFIHLFSGLVLYSVPAAFFAARKKDYRTHQYNMIGVYVGGILIAGGFAFAPGRLLHTWLF